MGAGIILVRNSSVITGLTTAAGMWATAAIGIAIGYGFYIGAIFAAVICFFTVTFLNRLEKSSKNITTHYIELTDISDTQHVIETIQNNEERLVSCDIVTAKSGNNSNVGIMCVFKDDDDLSELEMQLKAEYSVIIFLSNLGI